MQVKIKRGFKYLTLGVFITAHWGTRGFALCMGWTAQVTTRNQHDLAVSSINYMAVAYQTCGARKATTYMCYTLDPSGLSRL